MGWRKNMTLRKFLKPDRRKIVLWIILLLIIPIPNFYLMYLPERTEIDTTRPLSTPLVFPMPNLIFLILSPQNLISNVTEKPLIFITFLIVSYLLSCLIIWIYDKFRNRK